MILIPITQLEFVEPVPIEPSGLAINPIDDSPPNEGGIVLTIPQKPVPLASKTPLGFVVPIPTLPPVVKIFPKVFEVPIAFNE